MNDNTWSCLYCEYFDCGGQAIVERSKLTGEVAKGDCLNRLSPVFQCSSDFYCDQFTFSESLSTFNDA
jgi:hypothetical protein